MYCLGATPEVLRSVVEKIGQRFPRVVVAGSHHGYFGKEEEARDQVTELRHTECSCCTVRRNLPYKDQTVLERLLVSLRKAGLK